MRPYQRGFAVGLSICLLILFGVIVPVAYSNDGGQDDPPPKATPATKSKPTAVTKVDPINDTVTAPTVFHSSVAEVSDDEETKSVEVTNSDLEKIRKHKTLSWREGNPGIVGLVGGITARDDHGNPVKINGEVQMIDSHMQDAQSCKVDDKAQAYIFHITHLNRSASSVQVVSSSWYAYTLDWRNHLHFARFNGTGNQSVYGKTNALIVGLAAFNNQPLTPLDTLNETYNVSEAQGTPANYSDVLTLISAIAPFATPSQVNLMIVGTPPPPPPEYFVLSVGCQLATAKLPYTMTVTDDTFANAGDKPPDAPAAGVLTCAGLSEAPPCASIHAFESIDKEWWDVSVGMALPGVRETKFAFATNTVTTSVTTHTDLYALADFYWAAHWKPKDSWVPHPFVGLPVTGQTFYRPLFGMSENVTGWTHIQHWLSLPVGVNVFAGLADMKTHYLAGAPTTQAAFNTDLKATRVWKPVYGIEVPISSMASKLGKKSSAAPAKGSGGTS